VEAHTQHRDEWEKRLDEQLLILQQCQSDHQIQSCLSCPDLLGCKTRDSYVKAVYESMSKGHGGGFEF